MYWYKIFRGLTYSTFVGAMLWTVLLVLPFRPFSYLLPIVEHAGPGIWFLLAYVLFLVVGLSGFGVLSSLFYAIEIQERRNLNQAFVLSGCVLLVLGVFTSCTLLAVAGALGGYVLNINNESLSAAQDLLSSYVLPITSTSLLTVLGAALTLGAMIGAKKSVVVPSN
jgi:hypothetical protein